MFTYFWAVFLLFWYVMRSWHVGVAMRKADDTITVKAEEWTCNCNELLFPVNKKFPFVSEDIPLNLSHFKSNDVIFSVFLDYMLKPSISPISFQNKYFCECEPTSEMCRRAFFSLTQSDTDRRSAHLYRRWHLLICPIRFKSTGLWVWHLRFPLIWCDIF